MLSLYKLIKIKKGKKKKVKIVTFTIIQQFTPYRLPNIQDRENRSFKDLSLRDEKKFLFFSPADSGSFLLICPDSKRIQATISRTTFFPNCQL